MFNIIKRRQKFHVHVCNTKHFHGKGNNIIVFDMTCGPLEIQYYFYVCYMYLSHHSDVTETITIVYVLY